MAESFSQGDRVSWNTPRGRTSGRVLRKLTGETHVKGTRIAASQDDPRYLVESERTGEHAAHRPDALRRA